MKINVWYLMHLKNKITKQKLMHHEGIVNFNWNKRHFVDMNKFFPTFYSFECLFKISLHTLYWNYKYILTNIHINIFFCVFYLQSNSKCDNLKIPYRLYITIFPIRHPISIFSQDLRTNFGWLIWYFVPFFIIIIEITPTSEMP